MTRKLIGDNKVKITKKGHLRKLPKERIPVTIEVKGDLVYLPQVEWPPEVVSLVEIDGVLHLNLRTNIYADPIWLKV